jgi:hypothetical protein
VVAVACALPGVFLVLRRMALMSDAISHAILLGEEEYRLEHLHDHMRWEPDFAAQVVRGAERSGIILSQGKYLSLTDQGREVARRAIVS